MVGFSLRCPYSAAMTLITEFAGHSISKKFPSHVVTRCKLTEGPLVRKRVLIVVDIGVVAEIEKNRFHYNQQKKFIARLSFCGNAWRFCFCNHSTSVLAA